MLEAVGEAQRTGVGGRAARLAGGGGPSTALSAMQLILDPPPVGIPARWSSAWACCFNTTTTLGSGGLE